MTTADVKTTARPEGLTVGAPEEIIVAMDVDEVCCDGGHGALGHPRVWYNFEQLDHVVCGYCDRVFVKR